MKVTRISKRRMENGTALTEFTAALVLFFCFFFVPAVDMAFVPARYLLVNTYLEKVVHHMALSETRGQANKFFTAGQWKADVEKWGVTVKNAQALLIVNDNAGSKQITVDAGNQVPDNWLPHSATKGQSFVYSMELDVNAEIPPLFSSDVGLPGLNRPIPFTFRSRAQWENLGADPLTTDKKTIKYYMNDLT